MPRRWLRKIESLARGRREDSGRNRNAGNLLRIRIACDFPPWDIVPGFPFSALFMVDDFSKRDRKRQRKPLGSSEKSPADGLARQKTWNPAYHLKRSI
jgi:hypothetical protein